MKFPKVSEITARLREVRNAIRGCPDVPETDVRLQVHPDGSWAIRSGPSDNDQDHRGYWGAGVVGTEDTVKGVLSGTALFLLKQAMEMRYASLPPFERASADRAPPAKAPRRPGKAPRKGPPPPGAAPPADVARSVSPEAGRSYLLIGKCGVMCEGDACPADEAVAVVIVRATNMDGVLLDEDKLCKECAEDRGFQVGKL